MTPLLSVRNLSKAYSGRGRFTLQAPSQALDGVNLELMAGRTLAVVGPSGSGKSTLARCIAGLEQADAGEVLLDGRTAGPQTIHQRIQMIFQDPGASFNPRFTVAEALAEPSIIRGCTRAAESSIAEQLRQVGLREDIGSRFTGQLSGGQKARLALTRALAALNDPDHPCILILDESLSSLDLSVQAQIIDLLVDLQRQRTLSYILIAHDLSLAAHFAGELAVLWDGRVVEHGPPQALFDNPTHPGWRQLVSATMSLEKGDA